MVWTVTTLSVVVAVSAVVAVAVGLAALRQRPEPLAWPLAVTMFAVAAWAIPHAISLGYTDTETVALWHQLRYPGTVVAPVAYFVLTVRYADYDQWLSRRTYAGLALVPAVTVVVVLTNPYHGLFWRSLAVADVGGASVFVPEFGPWYWVNLAYLYLVTAASLVVLAAKVIESGRIYRKQALTIFVGGLVPLSTNVVANFAFASGPTVDFTTTALAVTGVTFALALFHFDLLDIRPVARDRLVEALEDGVVVVGPEGRIQDFNPSASRILGDLAVGRDAEAVFPSDVAPDGGELVAETPAGTRQFRTRSTALTDSTGGQIGRIVYLNDVTDLVEREQRVSVLNRVLRHNIRNELNVVSERLAVLEENASTDGAEHVATARERAQRVVDFAERARHVERTLQDSDSTMPVVVGPVVDRVVSEVRERHPDAVVEREPAGTGEEDVVSVVDETLFERALLELLDNAIVHSDRTPPRVTVGVGTDGDRIQLCVADNGPGIPEVERQALDSTHVSSLEHGSGLGLWLVTWTASLSSGTLSFDENEPRGTVAVLSLPRADG